MPTDQEHLELTTTFVDEASRGIARLRADLNQLTTGTGKAQLDAFRRGQEETGKKIKELAEAATGGDKALFSFAGKLGLAGVAAGTAGLAIHRGLEGLKAYSDKMIDLGNKARVMGVPAAELKSVVEQYERLGVPAAIAEQSVAGFADKLGSLGRIGSAERQEMIVAAGAFRNEMARAIQKIQEQDQLSDKLNVALELGQIVFNNRLKETHGNIADATKAENDFLALLGINPMLKHLENLDAISAADRKIVDQRYRNASEFHKALSDLRHEQMEWAADIKDSFLTADGLVMRGLREAVASMQSLREGSTRSVLGYWLGRAAGLPETGLLRHKEPEPAPARLLGETLAPGPAGTAADGSFGAAAERYGRIFGYSTNIEDRRSMVERGAPPSDLAETIAANTEEMKKLNEKLALLTRPDISLEGLRGLPGFGRGAGGGGATRGGGARGGATPGGGSSGGETPGGPAFTGTLAANQREAYAAALAEGLNEESAKALVANMTGESLADPGSYHWDRSHMSQGIVQWDPDRSAAIKARFGKEPRFMTVAEQTRAAIWEIRTNPRFRRTKQALEGEGSAAEKIAPLVENYEVPRDQPGAIQTRRGNLARLPKFDQPPPVAAAPSGQHAPGFKPISGSLSDIADSPEEAENKRLKEELESIDRETAEQKKEYNRLTEELARKDQEAAKIESGEGLKWPFRSRRHPRRTIDNTVKPTEDGTSKDEFQDKDDYIFQGRRRAFTTASAEDDRAQIDRSTERDVKVDMSGTLSADVNAPRGAKVSLEGGGLFNKTELSRQTPLGSA